MQFLFTAMHSKCKSQSFGSYDRRIVFAKSECAFDCSNDRGGSARFDKSAFWWWVTRLLAVIDSSSVVWCCFACNCKSLSHSLSLSLFVTKHAMRKIDKRTKQTSCMILFIGQIGQILVDSKLKKMPRNPFRFLTANKHQPPTTNVAVNQTARAAKRKKEKSNQPANEYYNKSARMLPSDVDKYIFYYGLLLFVLRQRWCIGNHLDIPYHCAWRGMEEASLVVCRICSACRTINIRWFALTYPYGYPFVHPSQPE